MEIYIKGIGIPTDNTVSIRVFPVSENGECYVQQLDVDGDILDELWAVPVPPHGRLIEESKVLDIVSVWCADDDGSVGKVGDLREMLDEIEALPTIIPAGEGE